MHKTIYRRGGRSLRQAVLVTGFAVSGVLCGHPIPDVLVESSFPADGPALVRVVMDPRCFEADPENVLYTFKEVFEADMTAEERDALLAKARAFVPKVLAVEFETGGRQQPEFEYDFEFIDRAELEQEDDVVFIVAKAGLRAPDEPKNYRIHALDHGDLSVIFRNTVRGTKLEQFQVLFPGETSYWLDLAAGMLIDPKAAAAAPAEESSRKGWTGKVVLGVALALLVLLIVRGALGGRVAHGVE